MVIGKKIRLRAYGGTGLKLGGVMAFALFVGEPIGWVGLAVVAIGLWYS